MTSRLRICIDARHATSKSGGIVTFTLSLARALLNLSDAEEQYFFLVKSGDGPNLEQRLQQSIHFIEAIPIRPSLVHRVAVRIPFARSAVHRLTPPVDYLKGTVKSEAAISGGMISRDTIDVIHFTSQGGFATDIPSIYQPHDLQHRHLPEFFTLRERLSREYMYSTLCEQAAIVCVVSQWVKQDLLDCFNLPESKVRVVHYAPPLYAIPEGPPEIARTTAQQLDLPQKFIFYPARTWPHKNHLRLFHALKLLRDRHGLVIPLVCSGAPTSFYPVLKAEVEALELAGQVHFVGYLDSQQLSATYRLCRAVVIPTLFEAGSFPLWEAFLNEKPAACSNVTSLPAQAGGAALVFDPHKAEEIADAVRRLWTDSGLCATLVKRGRSNINRYNWDATARTFRAFYRQLGKRQLSAADERLLLSPPLM